MLGKMGGSTAGGFAGGRGGSGGGTLKDQNNELTLLIKHLRKATATLSAYDKYMLESARKQQKAIQPDASIIGDVIFDDDASVWFGAVIRGDNDRISIGAGSNVQDGAVLHVDTGHPLTIGASCPVGHRAVLHGCTLADRVRVGMGSTILNGAPFEAN